MRKIEIKFKLNEFNIISLLVQAPKPIAIPGVRTKRLKPKINSYN